MDRLKKVIENLESVLGMMKEQGELSRAQLEVVVEHRELSFESLAKALHEDNLISADTLFTVTRTLSQLDELLEASTEYAENSEGFKKTTALIEHKLGILRLNFINASNNIKREGSHIA